MSARETVSSVAPTGADTRGSGSSAPHGEVGRGTLLGFAAYGLWGLFPLYFDALKPAGPWEILAHRILWTLLFCVVVLLVVRDLGWIRPLLRRPRLLAGTTVAAVLIAGNWVVYVAAVTSTRSSRWLSASSCSASACASCSGRPSASESSQASTSECPEVACPGSP